jgi:hypothetical protein
MTFRLKLAKSKLPAVLYIKLKPSNTCSRLRKFLGSSGSGGSIGLPFSST